jgi:hypothetical protein
MFSQLATQLEPSTANMKFSTIFISSLVGVASASNFKLRSAKHLKDTELIDARVAVGGLVRHATDGDLEIIGKTLLEAYNKAYGSAILTYDSFETQSHAPVPNSLFQCRRKCVVCSR